MSLSVVCTMQMAQTFSVDSQDLLIIKLKRTIRLYHGCMYRQCLQQSPFLCAVTCANGVIFLQCTAQDSTSVCLLLFTFSTSSCLQPAPVKSLSLSLSLSLSHCVCVCVWGGGGGGNPSGLCCRDSNEKYRTRPSPLPPSPPHPLQRPTPTPPNKKLTWYPLSFGRH